MMEGKADRRQEERGACEETGREAEWGEEGTLGGQEALAASWPSPALPGTLWRASLIRTETSSSGLQAAAVQQVRGLSGAVRGCQTVKAQALRLEGPSNLRLTLTARGHRGYTGLSWGGGCPPGGIWAYGYVHSTDPPCGPCDQMGSRTSRR